jgi:hypothetical protein
MTQVLTGLPQIQYNPKKHLFEGYANQLIRHGNVLSRAQRNEVITGHIYYSDEWNQLLRERNMKHIFLIRDIRDVVVSYNYYVEKANLPLYQFFSKNQLTRKDRLLCIINGINTPLYKHIGITEWFSQFKNWTNVPHVLTIKYEDLMSTQEKRAETLQSIIHYLYNPLPENVSVHTLINGMNNNIQPKKSGTFRKGKIGSWKDEFDEDIKEAFKLKAGHLLVLLDYERDQSW